MIVCFISFCLWANAIAAKETRMTRLDMQTAVLKAQEKLKTMSGPVIVTGNMKEHFPENMTLRVLVHEMTPYNLYKVENNSAPILTGYIAEMWKILETDLKFRSKYLQVSFEEGKNILKGGDADIMLSPVVVESKNFDHFDITVPIATSVYSLYMRPFFGRGTSSFYTGTWNRHLWLSFVCILLLCALLLWTMLHVRKRFGLDEKVHKKETLDGKNKNIEANYGMDDLSLTDCFYVVLAAATQQGVQFKSKACSTRLLLLILLIFNSLLITSYTSTIVSRLAVTHNSYQHTSLDTIRGSHSLYLCVRINSAVYSMFQVNDSTDEVADEWKSVVNRGPCHPFPRNTADVASNICKRRCVVFESDNIMARLLAKDRDCNTERLRNTRVLSQVGILIRKHFQYTHLLRAGILKLRNTGVLQLLETRFLFKNRQQNLVQRYSVVTWGNVHALVVTYGVALGLSLLLLGLEVCVGRQVWTGTLAKTVKLAHESTG